MQSEHSAVGQWSGGFDEAGIQKWAETLLGRLPAPQVSLGLVFMTPQFFEHATALLEILRVHARIPLLAGCSSQGLIIGPEELEATDGFVLALYSFPGAELTAFRFDAEQVSEANGPGYWHLETGISPERTSGWLVFADPFGMDCEGWLRGWNEAYPGIPVLGGLASGAPTEHGTRLFLNGDVFDAGGVAIAFSGQVRLRGVISQGCTPIGETWTITRAERNLIHEIGNRPAYEVLVETFNTLPSDEQKRSRGNLFIGLVMNEYLDEFRRGDFLIRNLVGADPKSGAIAVGAWPRAGQTIQFQRRDAAAATEDMLAMLNRAREELGSKRVYGGCLCCCNGRGQHLFGQPHHDAGMVQDQLGPLAVAGFFCNGELGPVGERSFLHGYTASLALFVQA